MTSEEFAGNFVFRAIRMLNKETSHGATQTACYRGTRRLDEFRNLSLGDFLPATRSGHGSDAGAVADRPRRDGHHLGRAVLVVARSTPEYTLAYVLPRLHGQFLA